ncbi:MAG: ferritin-like domain-containing protein [Myxococcales bacterium]|nr:ferritin-like domain-containing protein [Myxococcales bacterium]
MKVELTSSTAEWRKLRRAQTARSRDALVELDDGALPRSDAARRFWSRRTWSELAAVPAVSQVVLALVREGASLTTIGAYTTIAQDEVRHAELSHALAERLGGYDDDVPDGLDYAPRSLANPSDVSFAVWALANGCFSETVSLALIRARHAATTQPLVRAVLAETLKDEALHVRIAWQTAGEVLPNLSRADRKDLAGYGDQLAEMLRRTFGTAGLPPKLRRREDALRDDAAKAGLGSVAAAHENALIDEALAGIKARLSKLGVTTR